MGAKTKGFTLVELVVAIGVIALLTTILVPSIQASRRLAERGACRGNLHSVATALRMYLNDSDDYLPVAAQLPSAGLNDDPRIADLLAPHLSSPRALRCPGDPGEKYFRSEGSSYEYNSMLNGRKVGRTFLSRRLGEDKTPVMYDYRPFHGRAGTYGAANYLFADSHVGDLVSP